MLKIAVLVGSTRRDSINRKLAGALVKLGEGRFEPIWVRIDDLPLFSQDDEKTPTAAVMRMKAEIQSADGLLFVTPEHNRSIPSALKNAIDWATRPGGTNVLSGKPSAVAGTAAGRHQRRDRAAAPEEHPADPDARRARPARVLHPLREGLIDADGASPTRARASSCRATSTAWSPS